MKKLVVCAVCFGLLFVSSGCVSPVDKSKSPEWMDQELKRQGYDNFFISYTMKDNEAIYQMESINPKLPSITYTSGKDLEIYALKLQNADSAYIMDNKKDKTTLQLETCKLAWEHEKDIQEDSSCTADQIQAIDKDKKVYQDYFDKQQYAQTDMLPYLKWYMTMNSGEAALIYTELTEHLEALGYKQREKGVYQLAETTKIDKINGKNLVFDTNNLTFGFECTDRPDWNVKLHIKDHIISVNEYTFDFDSYHWIGEDPGLEIEQETIDMYRYMNNYIQNSGIQDFLTENNELKK